MSNNNYALAIDVDVCGANLARNINASVPGTNLGGWGHRMSDPTTGAGVVLPYMPLTPRGPLAPLVGAVPPMPSGAGVNNAMLNGRWRAAHSIQTMIYQQPLDYSQDVSSAGGITNWNVPSGG